MKEWGGAERNGARRGGMRRSRAGRRVWMWKVEEERSGSG